MPNALPVPAIRAKAPIFAEFPVATTITMGEPVDTVRGLMKRALEDMRDPQISTLARWLVRFLIPPNTNPIVGKLSEIAVVDQFVKRYVRYTRDPIATELVHRPTAILQRIREFGAWSEDCESMACFTMTLLMCLGHRCRLTIVGFGPPGRYQHIFTESLVPRIGWQIVDPSIGSLDQSRRMQERITTERSFYIEQLEL